jgi:acetolactate synthase-1/2/3 large subunit
MTTTARARKTEVMSGSDILVQSLVNHGVEVVFAYPGGCSMPLHQSLTRGGPGTDLTMAPRRLLAGTRWVASPSLVSPLGE